MALNNIPIEVIYGTEKTYKLIALEVPTNTTLEAAIQQSGILALFPEIDLQKQKIGVFSKQKQLSDTVNAGDRIEIYRPLTIDPMDARRAKAKKNS